MARSQSHKWIWVIIALLNLIVFTFVIVTAHYVRALSKSESGGYANVVSTLALFAYFETFVAIVWYTIETRNMQVAVSRQTDEVASQTRLSVLPAFLIEIGFRPFRPDDVDEDLNEYYLLNIGKGVALNIQINRRGTPELSYPNATITFERTLCIQPAERKKVSHAEDLGQPSKDHPPVDLITQIEKGEQRHINPFDYDIEFDDLLGNRYLQVLQMSEEGCVPRRIKLLSSADGAA